MSPGAAFQSPIFCAYLWILFALLLAAGMALAAIHFIAKKNLGIIWSTYRSWLVMGPLAALTIFFGRIPFVAGVAAVAMVAAREFAVVSQLDRATLAVLYAGIVAVAVGSFVSPEPSAILVVIAGLILILPILRNRPQGALRTISLGWIGFLYLAWMFGHLSFLTHAANVYGYLCFLLLATELNDVAAFTFGTIFGRHPLRSEISPRKTWEGAAGALALSLALPWVLRFSFPYFGALQLFLTGLIIGIGGQLGDLSISLIKRELGAKDMSAAIPGHGGVLDRIDSLIFTAPLFTHLVFYYYPAR